MSGGWPLASPSRAYARPLGHANGRRGAAASSHTQHAAAHLRPHNLQGAASAHGPRPSGRGSVAVAAIEWRRLVALALGLSLELDAVVSHIIRRRIFQIISGGRCADFPHYFGFTGSRHGLRRRISRPPDEGAGGSFRQARWDVALRSAGTGTGSGYAVVGARSARVRRRIRAGYPTPGRAAAVPRRRGVAGSRAGNSA